MTSDPHDRDREDQAEPEPEDEDEPAHRPGLADQRAALATARAILAADDGAAHEAAGTVSCQQCTTVAATSFGIAAAEQLAAGLIRKLAPGAELDVRPFRAAILDTIAETERDLRSMGN